MVAAGAVGERWRTAAVQFGRLPTVLGCGGEDEKEEAHGVVVSRWSRQELREETVWGGGELRRTVAAVGMGVAVAATLGSRRGREAVKGLRWLRFPSSPSSRGVE